ncbi:MAG TPA: outer membrane beta-barrel protein [Methylovirgula sp.]|nr:outer membrane beta-barrel protein [Methylovirgula sp.]
MVGSKDRLKAIAASAAAMLIAAASAGAWAQTAASQSPDSQTQSAPDQQAPDRTPPDEQSLEEQGLGLRGTTPPSLEAAPPEKGQVQTSDNANPIASPAPQYGLPPPVSDTTDVLNYGKPKPKKPKLYRLPRLKRVGLLPLQPLTSYKTAPLTQKRGSNPPLIDPSNPTPTTAVIPIMPQPRPPKPDPAPFAPLGIDAGSLRLFPYIETDTGYDSNPNRLASEVVGSAYVHGEAGLSLQSQWSNHSLSASLRTGYYDYFSVPLANHPEASGNLAGTIDVTRQTHINLASTFDIETLYPGSPIFAIPNSVFITNRPLIVSLGQAVGITQQFNRLSVSLTGAFARYMFGNATQSNNVDLLLSQDDYNDYGLTPRISYEVTPQWVPYIEVTGDLRRYDSYDDVYGFARSSNGISGKLGSTYEFTPLLTGEIAAGYAHRVYVDPRLPNIDTPTIDGKLIYAATPLTTVTLTGSTYISETTLANAAGAVSRSVSLGVTHALRRDLTLSALATYQYNIYVGQPITEQFYSAMIGANYNLTRSVVLTGSFTHQRFLSTAPGEDYTANVFLVGLRLQD